MMATGCIRFLGYLAKSKFILVSLVAMRWYPRGIQKLVSTYDLPENTQSAKICLNFNFLGVGVGVGGGIFCGSQK